MTIKKNIATVMREIGWSLDYTYILSKENCLKPIINKDRKNLRIPFGSDFLLFGTDQEKEKYKDGFWLSVNDMKKILSESEFNKLLVVAKENESEQEDQNIIFAGSYRREVSMHYIYPDLDYSKSSQVEREIYSQTVLVINRIWNEATKKIFASEGIWIYWEEDDTGWIEETFKLTVEQEITLLDEKGHVGSVTNNVFVLDMFIEKIRQNKPPLEVEGSWYECLRKTSVERVLKECVREYCVRRAFRSDV